MSRTLEYNATLTDRVGLTDKLAIFRFSYDDPPERSPWFTPGQYLLIGLNNEERPELGSVRRAMSIASPAQDGAVVEFYVRYVSDPTSRNPLTHLLWRLEVGQRALLGKEPKGRFTVPHLLGEDARLKVMVAAGTGLAPFVSYVRSRRVDDPTDSLTDVAILHGVSYPADLGYREELETLAAASELRYVATVSRPGEAKEWQGATGRVEDAFLAARLPELEARLGLAEGELTPERAAILVCGLQGTIGSCVERLAARGFAPDQRRLRQALGLDDEVPAHLFFEQYDTEPVLDLQDAELMARLRSEILAARTRG